MESEEIKLRIYNKILNYILERGFIDYNDFSKKLTNMVIRQLKKGEFSLLDIIRNTKSYFFTRNRLTKEEFYDKVLEKEILGIWQEYIGNKEVIKLEQSYAGRVERIYVDDVYSFKNVNKITPEDVKELLPLGLYEKDIKRKILSIIGEKYIDKDWGGEKADIITTRIYIKPNKRLKASFLLKGKGTKGQLTIRKCGKNGDQILRLSKTEADLYVIVHVDKIKEEVQESLERYLISKSIENLRVYYMLCIDGVDLARLLKAYNEL